MDKYKISFSYIIIFTIVSCSYNPIKIDRSPSSLTTTCRNLLSKLTGKSNPEAKATESYLREDISYEQVKKNISLKPGAILEQKNGINDVLQYLIDPSDPQVKTLLEKVTTDTKRMKPIEKIKYLDNLFSTLTDQSELATLKLRKDLNQMQQGFIEDGPCFFCKDNPLLFNLVMSEANLRPQLNYYKVWRKVGNELKEEEYGINTLTVNGQRVIFDPSVKEFHNKDLNEFLQSSGPFSDQLIGITQRATNPTTFLPTKKVNELDFTLKLTDSHDSKFNIVNRNKAGKKFRQEAQAFEDAGPEDDIDIEWVFTPYYVPLGHTNLRIGNSLYEFTSQGWKIHDTGGLTAETFLFNNSFFKKQYQTYKDKGMPAYSIGTSFTMKKREILEFLESINGHDPETDSFSLLTRNCNQCAIDELKKVNFEAAELSGSKFQEFSSVWTFRRLLHAPPFSIKESNIYHLSGDNEPMTSFESNFPNYLYEKHTIVDEVMRIIRGLNDRRKMQ